MSNKIGNLVERLTGARLWFVPDGSNIGTELVPALTSKSAKPATDEAWADYDAGKVTKAVYDPVTVDREREWAKLTGGYQKRKEKIVLTDAFDLTMVEYADALFDELMFGLASAPVADVAQAPFANAKRYKDGWSRLLRLNEDGTTLCLLEFRTRIQIKDFPADSSEPGSPVWRIEALGDADAALETIVFNPAAEV